MYFTLFCSIASAFAVYLVLKRVHQSSITAAVHSAVHEIKKELQERNANMVAQLAAKERELVKVRELIKLHESMSGMGAPAKLSGPATFTMRSPDDGKGDRLSIFEMSRPFTDTSYDALLAVSDVVKVEPAGM